MRILFLSSWFPYPPNNGSKIRIYNLLRGLAEFHEVTLLSFADGMNSAQPEANPNVAELRTLCREVQLVPNKSFDPLSLRARLGFFSLTPRSVVDTFSQEMKQRIEQSLAATEYDLIIASETGMAVYSRYFGHRPAVLDELQVAVPLEQFNQADSFKGRLRHGLTWAKHRRYLASLLKNFETCVVASSRERQLVSEIAPAGTPIEIIPNCVNLTDYSTIHEVPRPNTLIFTGSFSFLPNYQGMVWFLQEVYPRLQARLPELVLTITGDHANRPLPPATNVVLAGFVDDVRPLIASAWVSLVPIHVGGGTRLKILEAMALGTPVVATSKGAEGLEAEPGVHLLIADSPESFAEAIFRLHQEPGLRARLVANAYRLVREKYDWAATMPRFLELVERVARA